MKATIDIPDELYRRVKAKSALEGRHVRDVTIALYEEWLNSTGENNVEQDRAARQKWLEELLEFGRQAFKDAPPGPTAREILIADRNRLEPGAHH